MPQCNSDWRIPQRYNTPPKFASGGLYISFSFGYFSRFYIYLFVLLKNICFILPFVSFLFFLSFSFILLLFCFHLPFICLLFFFPFSFSFFLFFFFLALHCISFLCLCVVLSAGPAADPRALPDCLLCGFPRAVSRSTCQNHDMNTSNSVTSNVEFLNRIRLANC
jgi:hypothetical protein